MINSKGKESKLQDAHRVIEEVLNLNRNSLGRHFEKYKNHVYRVFYLCQLFDDTPENIEKYAIASVFHDIGIWTDQTFDYLSPSMKRAKAYLIETEKVEWSEEILLMIDMHHKRTRYKGSFERTVECFRKSDWVDLTNARMSFSLNREKHKQLVKTHPYLGFRSLLVKKTIEQFFKSPTNPLPMFKK